MSKGKVYWDGCCNVEYKGIYLDIDLSASGTYQYSPGCMYRSNGDPGDPPEEETEVDSIDIEGIWLDGVDISKWLKDEVISDITSLCREAIEDGQVEMESCEPDYDDYDEEN